MNRADVEEAYRAHERLSDQQLWGWSFMYVPEARMQTASVALVGLNPGGSQRDGEGHWDYQGINAYTDQSWRGRGAGKSPLQVQIAALLEALSCDPGDVFAAQFVPFRSPDWAKLPNRKAALAFGRQLWSWVLTQSPATLFLCIGKRTGDHVADLLDAKLTDRQGINWGSQTIDVFDAPDGRRVVSLPHLSRYQFLTSRPETRDYLASLRSER